ncbi:UDP-N-acetylenolpyruvoylglucosamine reductase, putative [Verrucomicrobiia bacterium DG1235]|nr:UDP-N-acetylenolpyruvoylglucosamine reductase, putative [Verrucomicrobiae bacterium DG1235]
MIEGLPKRIHCLGAAGAGMLPLTLYLANAGHDVSAEDSDFGEEALKLLECGGVRIGSYSEAGEAGLVYSSAIAEDHPARVLARAQGSVCLRRGECLALISRGRKLIAIAGSHGKTTTCGMLIDVLDTLGFGCDYLLGAQFSSGDPYRSDGNEWLVAEIDESDGTIDLFEPEITVIVNVDHDHHARYATEEAYFAAFEGLVARTRGQVILNADVAERLRSFASVPLLSLGEGGEVGLKAERAGSSWTSLSLTGAVTLDGALINRSGQMNACDAGFAFLASGSAGARIESGQAFEFRSIKRRQRCWYNSPNIQVFEDYAHHPEEIDSVFESFGTRKGWSTVVVFQAHRYSRTRELKRAFARSLANCEELVLLDVYAASESPLEGGMAEDLLSACRERTEKVVYVPESSDPIGMLAERARRGPTRILFLGAGNGDRHAKALRDRLVKSEPRWGSVYESLAEVSSFETVIREEEPMASKTTLRVGGVAERYFEPESLSQLLAVLKACYAADIPARPLGRGSNLLVPDEGVSGLVIRLGHPYWSRFELLGEGRARLGAGMRIKALCGQAAKEGLVGFEFLEGIPGSLGGVLRMNAGAMGGWVFDVVESIRYVTLKGEVLEATKGDLEFGYRYCRELESAIAIDAVLVSNKGIGSQEEIRRTIDTYQNKRKESQPREPSAGCIFKNPEGDSAGRLIDELGLKGAVVGGAEISHTHGNFIINRGGARSSDVIELVKFVRKVARERKGVDLHPEVLLFGTSWEDTLR